MQPLKVGIVGCGRMGTERADAVIKVGARIVWFCDIDPARAEALASRFSDTLTAKPEELDLHSVDAVFVCVPPAYRGPIELRCLASSVPLFVEKPIGLSAEHAFPLLEQSKRSVVINAVGYMNRYRNSVRLARDILSGRNILGITCVWVGRKYRVPWWTDSNLSGGPFNEQATHAVDLCRCLVGEIGATTSVIAPSQNSSDPEFGVAVAMGFLNGPVGTVFYNCEAKEKDIRLHVFCEDGTLDFEGWDLAMTRNTIDGKLPKAEQDEIFVKETRAFLNAIRSGDQSLVECDLAQAYRTQQVVDKIRHSFNLAR
jgi:myo-inositol 2-dehydrogenase/D-chiro-inositol 1-dehydrogenase